MKRILAAAAPALLLAACGGTEPTPPNAMQVASTPFTIGNVVEYQMGREPKPEVGAPEEVDPGLNAMRGDLSEEGAGADPGTAPAPVGNDDPIG